MICALGSGKKKAQKLKKNCRDTDRVSLDTRRDKQGSTGRCPGTFCCIQRKTEKKWHFCWDTRRPGGVSEIFWDNFFVPFLLPYRFYYLRNMYHHFFTQAIWNISSEIFFFKIWALRVELFCAHLCSFALICVFCVRLRFRTTAFGNCIGHWLGSLESLPDLPFLTYGEPCLCPLPEFVGRFDENGENDEFAFYPLKTRASLLRPPKMMQMKKMAGATQAKAMVRKRRFALP